MCIPSANGLPRHRRWRVGRGFEAIEQLVADLPEDYVATIFHCTSFGLLSVLALKEAAVENSLHSALAQSEEMSALREGSLSMAHRKMCPIAGARRSEKRRPLKRRHPVAAQAASL